MICYERHDPRPRSSDDGAGPADEPQPPSAGTALVGMRERVALFGGELETGPRRGGGYSLPRALCPSSAGGGQVSVRVLLVDDQALIRAGFRMILEAEEDIEVVGEAPTAPRRSTASSGCGRTWC